MKLMFKSFSLVLALAIIFSLFSFVSSAAVDTAGAGTSEEKNILPGNQVSAVKYTTDIKSCANMGNWQSYAENSLEAVEACETDYVSVDVKLTKDNIAILMKDDTLERMCVDAEGKAVSGAVKDKTFDEISTYRLRMGNGGKASKASNYTVPTLDDVLNALNEGTSLIIDTDSADLSVIYNTVLNAEKLNSVLFRLEDCDSKDITSIVTKNEKLRNLIIPEYNGNIIFGATTLLKEAEIAGLNIVKLGTKNVNGVIFYDSFTKKFKEKSVMAMFSMVDEYCAERSDDITGWDNAIACGYSIIETNYPEMLEKYIKDTAALKDDLKSLTDICEPYIKGDFSSESFSNFTSAYENATLCLNSVSSRSEISKAFYDLSQAYSRLEPADENETIGKFTFSAGRVIAVLLCGSAFVVSQVYLYKKRKK